MVEEWRGRTPWAVRGGSTMAALATFPSPVFAYKNRGRGRPKKGVYRRGRKKKQTERDNKRRERTQKSGEGRAEKVGETERGTKLKEKEEEQKKTEE